MNKNYQNYKMIYVPGTDTDTLPRWKALAKAAGMSDSEYIRYLINREYQNIADALADAEATGEMEVK